MPNYSLALDRASVVLLGKFNPSIFHPAWFARYSLIRDEEASEAKQLIVTDAVTKFQCDWLEIQVTTDRFQAQTDDTTYAAPLRDLVASSFSLLEHTPFWALGINRHLHYKLESVEQWHRFGHFLAPKKHWEKHLSKPGTRTLVIEGYRPGATLQVPVQWTVQPSLRVHPGVYFALNQHYGRRTDQPPPELAKEPTQPEGRRELIEALTRNWEDVQTYARTTAELLLSEEY